MHTYLVIDLPNVYKSKWAKKKLAFVLFYVWPHTTIQLMMAVVLLTCLKQLTGAAWDPVETRYGPQSNTLKESVRQEKQTLNQHERVTSYSISYLCYKCTSRYNVL